MELLLWPSPVFWIHFLDKIPSSISTQFSLCDLKQAAPFLPIFRIHYWLVKISTNPGNCSRNLFCFNQRNSISFTLAFIIQHSMTSWFSAGQDVFSRIGLLSVRGLYHLEAHQICPCICHHFVQFDVFEQDEVFPQSSKSFTRISSEVILLCSSSSTNVVFLVISSFIVYNQTVGSMSDQLGRIMINLI